MATKLIKISRDAQADFAGDFSRFEHESKLSIFTSHMSQPARTILGLLLERLFRFTSLNDKSILIEFAKQYNAVTYDDAVLCWNYAELIDWIKRGTTWQGKKKDEVLAISLLRPLYDHQLKIDDSANKQFRIGNNVQRNEVYDYLTKEFLVHDFTYNDLITIGQIAKDYSVIRIRDKCQAISSADKHTIPYLSSILHNDKQKESALKQNRDKAMDQSAVRIAAYLAELNTPVMKLEPDLGWSERLRMEQELKDELKALVAQRKDPDQCH
jgi:hypothetical protein